MNTRQPAVAGTFYPADGAACRTEVEALFASARAGLAAGPGLPARIVAGIVPHAGLVFSGEVAARTLEAIASQRSPATFVIFGAMHRAYSHHGLVFDGDAWQSPLGRIDVDLPLARRLMASSDRLLADTRSHAREHSVEVQVPLIQVRFPSARLVAILVPPTGHAADIGATVGCELRDSADEVVLLGSTDLTHYGPRYGFTPQGVGEPALAWAKQTNDASVLRAIETLDARAAMGETIQRQSACGGGAIAAALAAARELGATRGVILEHITSADVMRDRFGESSEDAVGYASAVLG